MQTFLLEKSVGNSFDHIPLSEDSWKMAIMVAASTDVGRKASLQRIICREATNKKRTASYRFAASGDNKARPAYYAKQRKLGMAQMTEKAQLNRAAWIESQKNTVFGRKEVQPWRSRWLAVLRMSKQIRNADSLGSIFFSRNACLDMDLNEDEVGGLPWNDIDKFDRARRVTDGSRLRLPAR